MWKTLFAAASAAALTFSALADEPARPVTPDDVARGEYLVSVIGCSDCHTPGHFFGQPDRSKFLAGSDVAFVIPGLGYFFGSNLTSDEKTGLGAWTLAEISDAVTKGVRPDGRMLAPSMPWMNFANLTPDDAFAIAAYLKGLPPVSNAVPAPTGWGGEPPGPVMGVTMPKTP